MILPLILPLLLSWISSIQAQTHCHTTSWWVLLPFERSVLQPFLSSIKDELTFNTSNPLSQYMNASQHPVYFEFNQQNQCEQSSLPAWLANLTEQTFVEFKLEIPYLIRKGKAMMIKPLIYQNDELDVAASHLVYGLPAFHVSVRPSGMGSDHSQRCNRLGHHAGRFQPQLLHHLHEGRIFAGFFRTVGLHLGSVRFTLDGQFLLVSRCQCLTVVSVSSDESVASREMCFESVRFPRHRSSSARSNELRNHRFAASLDSCRGLSECRKSAVGRLADRCAHQHHADLRVSLNFILTE